MTTFRRLALVVDVEAGDGGDDDLFHWKIHAVDGTRLGQELDSNGDWEDYGSALEDGTEALEAMSADAKRGPRRGLDVIVRKEPEGYRWAIVEMALTMRESVTYVDVADELCANSNLARNRGEIAKIRLEQVIAAGRPLPTGFYVSFLDEQGWHWSLTDVAWRGDDRPNETTPDSSFLEFYGSDGDAFLAGLAARRQWIATRPASSVEDESAPTDARPEPSLF